ncbi:hypothetical protein ACVDG8_001710 [Mesorhizobium sp. ORM8.1]
MDCLEELRASSNAEQRELINLATSGAGSVADRFIGMVEQPFDEKPTAKGGEG